MSYLRLLVLFAVACGRDVRLGADLDAALDAAIDAAIDAPIDALASNNPFASGDYMMRFFDPPLATCDGSLSGMEASFMSITRADLALVDGTVTFEAPTDTTLAISGAPITTGWGLDHVDLVPNAAAPPGFWDVLISGNFGTGPLDTTRFAIGLVADSATSTTPSGIEAQVFVFYSTLDTTGTCDLSFATLFTKL